MSFAIRGLSATEIESMIPQSPILVGYRGSIAHGMWRAPSVPTSIDDKDLMAVCIPRLDYYFGSDNCGFGDRGVKEAKRGEWDMVSYEFRKYVGLLCKSNPNVLSILWNEPQYQIYVSPIGEALIAFRDHFASKLVYHAFAGYAHGQLHRMTHQAFEGYMGEKRKKLVEQFGYDTKNASHCIRLLRMGIEFLIEGRFYVDRSQKDGPQLLEIKTGAWSLEQVRAEADRLFRQAEDIYAKSTLPSEPNREEISQFLTSTLWDYFHE